MDCKNINLGVKVVFIILHVDLGMSWSEWTRRNGAFSVSITGVLGLLLTTLIVFFAINL